MRVQSSAAVFAESGGKMANAYRTVVRGALEAAFQYSRRFAEADLMHLRDTLADSPRCTRNDVPDAQILQTRRLGLASLHMAAESGYIGCIIKSWPDLFDQYHCATDGAVSMLNDIGLCTDEEGEMNGLLSSLSASASGRPGALSFKSKVSNEASGSFRYSYS